MSNFLDQVERIANGINTTTSPEVLKNWVEIQLILAYKAGLDRAKELMLSSVNEVLLDVHSEHDKKEVSNG